METVKALRQLVRRTLQNFVRHQNPPEMVIDGLTYTRTGGLELVASHPGVAMLAAHLAAYFKAQGGINYVEFSAWNAELGELTFTVQRRDGETPAQQAARWKRLYEELKSNPSHHAEPRPGGDSVHGVVGRPDSLTRNGQ